MKNSDHRGMSTQYRANDAAFRAAIRAHRHDIYQNTIAVHGVADSGRWNENISNEPRLQRCIE